MNPVIQKLLASGPVVIDGAWGTQLQALGLPVGACPDAWNLSNPDKVEQVARAYVAAGSRIILTNTFGANRLNLARHGLAGQTAEINRRGVEISRRAAAGKAEPKLHDRAASVPTLVFASMGPSGKLLMSGETSEEELSAAFAEQAQELAKAGADGLVLETMTDLDEAKIAVAAAKATGRPVVASMVFDSGKDRDRTMMGVTIERAAEELGAAGADVIGANCGQGIEGFAAIGKRLRAATDRPIWLKPNAGMPEMIGGRAVYRTTADEFARFLPDLVAAGASFVGGCCGTAPAFVQAISKGLRR